LWKKKGELGRDYTFEVFYDCNEFDLNSSRVIPDIFVWCLLDSSLEEASFDNLYHKKGETGAGIPIPAETYTMVEERNKQRRLHVRDNLLDNLLGFHKCSDLLRFQIDDQLSGLQDWSLHWADAIVKAYLQTDKRARKKAVITRVTEAVDSMTSEIDQITSPLKPSYTQIE